MHEDRGTSIAIVVVVVVFLAAMPFLIPTLIWIALSVYAIVKGAGSAPEDADPAAVILTIVGIVTVLSVLIAGAVALLGRAMTPKKRRRGGELATAG